jgi:hypothetical protein
VTPSWTFRATFPENFEISMNEHRDLFVYITAALQLPQRGMCAAGSELPPYFHPRWWNQLETTPVADRRRAVLSSYQVGLAGELCEINLKTG